MPNPEDSYDSDISDEEKSELPEKCKLIISNIVAKCKTESEIEELLIPVEYYMKRAAYYTGYPQHIIRNIQSKTLKANTNKNFKRFDYAYQLAILQSLGYYYINKEVINFKNVFMKTQDYMTRKRFMSLDEFYVTMDFCGYKYKDMSWGRTVVEDPNLVFQRFQYLKAMSTIREKGLSNIYYVDVRVVDSTLSFEKPHKTEKSNETTEKYNCFHVVSKFGYNSVLFCHEADSNDVKKWLLDIVMPTLKPKSTIVFDQSPIYNERSMKRIKFCDSKEVMLKWLKDKNVPHSNSMRKAELYFLINKFYRKYGSGSKYLLDSLFEAHGHQVLRLPLHYDFLSPTYSLWKKIKTEHKLIDTSKESIMQLKDNINMILNSLSLTKWQYFMTQVQSMEKEIWKVDEQIENAMNEIECRSTVEVDNENVYVL